MPLAPGTAAWILLLPARMASSHNVVLLACVAALGLTAGATADPVTEGTPETARLQVVTPSAWGEILVDGVPRGLAPVHVELAPGRHWINVLPSTYHEAASREVELIAGQHLQLAMWPTLRPSWLVIQGFPDGTVLRIDDGPGPLVEDGTRVVIDDGASHSFTFQLRGRTLHRVLVKRCIEVGCLLPGAEQVVRWSPQRR